MARVHGRNGALYMGIAGPAAVATPVAFISKWTLPRATDAAECTAFGDSNKIYVTGLPDSQGTYAGFYDTVTAQMYTAASDGSPRKFYLYPDTTDTSKYFFGTAYFDTNIEVPVDGVASISGSFRAASDIVKV